MPEFIFLNDQVFSERDSFNIVDSGSDELNFLLKGLRYKLTIKAFDTLDSVDLYSSDVFGNLNNKFSFTQVNDITYSYEETAGEGATSLGIVENEFSNFRDGIKFYLKIRLVSKNNHKDIDRIICIREPDNIILFDTEQLYYKTPYPVLIGKFIVPVTFSPLVKNSAGVVKRAGIKTVQVFSNPLAPSTGSHVTAIAETLVDSLTQIVLPDRTSLGSIPNFVPPPGTPDFSRFYHFITFRLRSKLGSAFFKDVNVILFAARECTGSTGTEVYGYDSTGETLPAPSFVPLFITTETPPPPEYPPPVCSSKTPIETDEPLNVYTQETNVAVYTSLTGGTLLGRAPASNIQSNSLEVKRVDFGDANINSQPITGYIEIEEKGPDRNSENRVELIIHQCSSTPIEIEIPESGTPVIITTTGRPVDPGKTYLVRLYDQKHGGTLIKTFTAEATSGTTLEFTVTEEETGFWVVVENGIEISGFRVEQTVVDFVYPLDLADMETFDDDYATITWLRGLYQSEYPDGLQGPTNSDFTYFETRQGTFGTGGTIAVLPTGVDYVIKFTNLEIVGGGTKTLYALKGFRKSTTELAWNSPSNNIDDLFQFYVDETNKVTLYGTIPTSFSGAWSFTSKTVASLMQCYILRENGTSFRVIEVADNYDTHTIGNILKAQIFNMTDRKKSPVLDVFISSKNDEDSTNYSSVSPSVSCEVLRSSHPIEKLGLSACSSNSSFSTGFGSNTSNRCSFNWQDDEEKSSHMPGERKLGFYKELDLANCYIKVYSYDESGTIDDFSDFSLIKSVAVDEVIDPLSTEMPIIKADKCYYTRYYDGNIPGDNPEGASLSVFAFTREKFTPTLLVDRVHLLKGSQIVGGIATHPPQFKSFRVSMPNQPILASLPTAHMFTPNGETDPFYRMIVRGIDADITANFTINIYKDHLPLTLPPDYVAQFVGKEASATTLSNGEKEFDIGFKLPGTGIDFSTLFTPNIPTDEILAGESYTIEVVQDSPYRKSQGYITGPITGLFTKGQSILNSTAAGVHRINGSISFAGSLFEKNKGFYDNADRYFLRGSAVVLGVDTGIVITKVGNGTYIPGFENNGGRVEFSIFAIDWQYEAGGAAPNNFTVLDSPTVEPITCGDITNGIIRSGKGPQVSIIT